MPDSIPALTVHQPWASLIALEAKRIATRSWSTNYRGPLLIHAAQEWTRGQKDLCGEPPFYDLLHNAGYVSYVRPDVRAWSKYLPLGKVVAIATLTECRPTGEWTEKRMVPVLPCPFSTRIWEDASWLRELSEQEIQFGDYGEERFGWFLEHIRLLKPFHLRGQQRLWHVPLSIMPDEVREYVNDRSLGDM